MATTAAGAALTVQHRAQQLAVRARNLQGLMQLWSVVNPADLKGTIDVFVQAAVLLAGQGFEQSAVLAGQYFGLFREAEEVAGLARAVIAARPAAAVLANDLRGAALSGIIDGRRSGMSIEAASRNGLIKVSGTFVKQVLGGGRMTITGSIGADRRALGWTRVTSGDPCAFCRSLSARGATYKTEKSASFEPHDHCGCTPEPLYRGRALNLGSVEQSREHEDEFKTAQEWARSSGTMSSGTSNDALNNYRRWVANGSPEPGANTPREA